MLNVCEAIYGLERGRRIRAVLESGLGEPCPCRQGQSCPLMPTAPRESLDGEPLGDLA
jgi:hypothetical protein